MSLVDAFPPLLAQIVQAKGRDAAKAARLPLAPIEVETVGLEELVVPDVAGVVYAAANEER